MVDSNFKMPWIHDFKILSALAEDGGFTALAISDRSGVGDGSGRMRSGAMRSWLTLLEARGLAARMDDQRPICWIRTPAGTAALQQIPWSSGSRRFDVNDVVGKLRWLCSPEAGRLSDGQRINSVVTTGHEACDEIERLRKALSDERFPASNKHSECDVREPQSNYDSLIRELRDTCPRDSGYAETANKAADALDELLKSRMVKADDTFQTAVARIPFATEIDKDRP